jgi:L-lactate utilization protein LutB
LDDLDKVEAKQMEHDTKYLAQEQKQERTNHFMLAEIKRTNEETKQNVIKTVDAALAKTNKEVLNIQQ